MRNLVCDHDMKLTTNLQIIGGIVDLVAALLRLCQDGLHNSDLKALAYQTLANLAIHAKQYNILRTKPAILSLTANALDHPDAFLRQAAAQARNEWFLA